MPIDPRLPLTVQAPKYSSPLDDYAKFMSLRDMVDQRRVRDLQVRRLELQEQEAAREQEEYQRLQTALPSLGAESTPVDWIKAGGLKSGLAGYEAYQKADKARRDAAESAAKAEKERLDAENRRGLMLANQAESLTYLGDDPELQQSEYRRAAPYFEKAGWITPEQAAAPLDMNIVNSLIVRGGGAERLEKVRNDVAKRREDKADAGRKAYEENLKIFGRVLGFVKTPDDWGKVIPTAPVEIRSLFPREVTPEQLPAVLQQATAMTMSPAERQAAAPKTLAEWEAVAVNPATSAIDKKIADQMVASLGSGQRAGTEAKLRDDYRSDKDVQNFIVRRDAYQEIKGALQSEGGISDLKLIFSYIRMLDPGSTVREGEAASVSNAAGIGDQLRNMYNRVVNGGKLPPEIRKDILRETEKTFSTASGNYEKKVNQYGEMADRNKVDRRNVLIDYTASPAAPAGNQQPVAGAPAPAQQPATVGGIPNPIVGPGTGTMPRSQPAAAAESGGYKAGDIVEGDDGWYRYDGGNYEDRKNWKKVREKK